MKTILNNLTTIEHDLDSATRYNKYHFSMLIDNIKQHLNNLKKYLKEEHLLLITSTLDSINNCKKQIDESNYKEKYKMISNTIGTTTSLIKNIYRY